MKNTFVKLSINLEYWFSWKCLLKMFVYVCISSYGDANPFMQFFPDCILGNICVKLVYQLTSRLGVI